MKLQCNKQCDVLIIGAGLAGIRAAMEISGYKVILASSNQTFGGSSFYPGTWGLGLVGPKDLSDHQNFKDTIRHVGSSMCNDLLVDTFVEEINECIDELKEMGVSLKQATNQSQKEFIPCFDYQQRNWNGLQFDSLKSTCATVLKQKQVEQLEYHEVVDIVIRNKKVCGVIVCNQKNQLQYIGCRSVIIASGGFGGLYQYCLNTNDITGVGQYLALKSGATLVNIEFIQMMLGFIKPLPKTIYNEKMFKYTTFYHNQIPLFTGDKQQELLSMRATYGPFTSRLPSRNIDITLFKYFKENPCSLQAVHDATLKDTKIEFIKTYFDWLEKEKKVRIDEKIKLGVFYHAANGGIQIDKNGATGVKGLYACGEATGGMHGSDRIGGLSSANGLVFGRRVGKNVPLYLKTHDGKILLEVEFNQKTIKDANSHLSSIQKIMSNHAMIVRNQTGLELAMNQIEEIEHSLEYQDNSLYRETTRLLAAMAMSKALLKAMLMRKESRGSHYREDYPEQNKEYNSQICIQGLQDMLVYFNRKE